MLKKFVLGFAVVALAVASAETYKVTLYNPSFLKGQELKPGNYKLDVKDSKAVLSQGKTSVEAPVKVENGTVKFNVTQVRLSNEGGKFTISAISLGGTNTRLVFDE